MQKLKELFKEYTSEEPLLISPLPFSGSHRRYVRMSSAKCSVMGVIGTDAAENNAFFAISKAFRSQGINAPEVLAASGDSLRYLQQDLGDDTLFSLLENGRASGEYSEGEKQLLRKTIAMLPAIQFKVAEKLNFDECYPRKEFCSRTIDFDLNYFKYDYLKLTGVEFNEERLQDDFEALKKDLLMDFGNTFMYRDFQARNVMIKDGEPWFIDFQGGRRGPIYYDIASFLYQARARYSEDLREDLLQTYFDASSALPGVAIKDEASFKSKLRLFVLFRGLQVLGAYGFRGIFERKPHFLQSLPLALEGMGLLLKEPFDKYPYLNSLLTELVCRNTAAPTESDIFEVQVSSFSYRKCIPSDDSGNGGGYVFDCRGLHNPGKYKEYMDLTGLDEPVIKFLEDDGEIVTFLDSAYKMVDHHIERFIQRGLKHLQISFGCTGGHHRSVYCAQHIAEHIAAKYGIRVKLTHIELGIKQEF